MKFFYYSGACLLALAATAAVAALPADASAFTLMLRP